MLVLVPAAVLVSVTLHQLHGSTELWSALDGLFVALECVMGLVQRGHGCLELGADALHVKILGRMQQLMAPLMSELDGVVDLFDASMAS